MSVVSPTQASLLTRDQDVRPFRQAFVVELDRDLSRDDLVEFARERLAQAPRFRQLAVGWPAPHWADDPGFELSGHVRETTLPPGQPIESWIGHRLAMPSDRTHPLWQAWLVRLADGPTALVGFVHPALLIQPGPDADANPVSQVATGVTSMIDNAWRTLGAKKTEFHVSGEAVELADLRTVARGFGCAVDDVVLAVVAAGLRRWWVTRDDDPIALVSLGGKGGLVALPVQVDPVAQLTELASMTATWADGSSPAAADLGAALAQAAQVVVGAPPHAVLVLGAGSVSDGARVGKAQVHKVTVFATPTDDEEVTVTAADCGDRVLLGATAKAALTGFGRGVRDGLAMLVAMSGKKARP